MVITVGLGAGLALAGPLTATAATGVSSYASAQFLSGSLLGGDLADVAELGGVEEYNNGNQNKQVSQDPLSASVLQSVDVDVPGGVQIPVSDFVDAGTLGQYAEADKNGTSLGASGAVGNGGAIGAGAVTPGAAGDLSLDVDPLVEDEYAGVLGDLNLALIAVAAQAKANLNVATGDYRLDGAVLSFNSPAIGDLTSKVTSALAPIDGAIADLNGPSGELAGLVSEIVSAINPALNLIGSDASVNATVTTNVHAAVQSLLGGTYGNGAVSFDLNTGNVEVDLEALHGGSLNNLPANTELLTDAVVSQILTGITETIDSLIGQIMTKVETSLGAAAVNIEADLDLSVDAQQTVNEVCNEQQVEVPIVGDVTGGLLGGLLDPVTGPVTKVVTQLVCSDVLSIIPAVDVASLQLDINGTVKQILNGTPGSATATATVAGLPVALDIDDVLANVALGLTDSLFDLDGGAVNEVLALLNSGLLAPAVDGLLGNGITIESLLTDVLSLRVNVQELSTVGAGVLAGPAGSYFTETALRVSVLGGDLTTVNVAAATVGPNINQVIDSICAPNCGPGTPGNPGNPGNPGDPGNLGNPSASAIDRLATTGVGIATLIAVLLALLAAGAYLAREGYRKNHPQPLS